MGQQNGIDIFGGNSLGVADAWNQVRIGGALGGDSPAEALRKGSIAIFSNSGNFTTTIAHVPAHGGLGHDDASISSGKDVYIHYAAPEFAFALANDARSKAAVLYVRAGRLLRARRRLHQAGGRLRGRPLEEQADARGRPCRRDGGRRRRRRAPRNAGSWRSSASTASSRRTTRSSRRKGARGHQHRPHPGGADRGDARQRDAAGLRARRQPGAQAVVRLEPGARRCRTSCDLPVVEAIAPYDEQIAQLNRQIGAVFPRQTMKDASGASQMDAKTQVTQPAWRLDAGRARSIRWRRTSRLALVHEAGGENDRALIDVAVGRVRQPARHDPALAAAQAAREAGNAPNAVLAAAASIVGPKRQERRAQARASC